MPLRIEDEQSVAIIVSRVVSFSYDVGNISPIIVSGALCIAREDSLEAYSLHGGLGLYCNKSLIHYMRATYHPLLYLGPQSLRERNISKFIRYMRDLAFIVTKASSMKHHYFNALSMMRRTHKAYYYKRPAIIKRTSWIFESTNKGRKTNGKTPRSLSGNVRGAETRPWSTKPIIA